MDEVRTIRSLAQPGSGARLRSPRALRLALSVIGALFVLRSLWFVVQNITGAPFYDTWFWIDDLARWQHGGFTLRALFAPWNEHRIATTRLLLWADARWFHMRGVLPVATSIVAYAATGLIWARVCRPLALPALFWVAFFLATNQRMNLLAPFQVQFALATLFVVATFALLVVATERSSRSAVAYAGAAGLTTCLGLASMASTVLATPVALLLLLSRRGRRVVWLGWGMPTAVGLFLYLQRFPTGLGYGQELLNHTGVRLTFAATLIASGFFSEPAPSLALPAMLGVFLVLVATALSILCLRRGFPGRPQAIAIATIVWTLLCAAAPAVTLRGLGGATGGLADQYCTITLLFTAAIVVLLLREPIIGRPRLVVATAVAALALMNASDGWPLAGPIRESADLLANNVALNGRMTFLLATPDIDGMRPRIAFLHAGRLSLFAPALRPSPGTLAAVAAADIARLPHCPGAIDGLWSLDAHAIQITGWLATPKLSLPDWIVARDHAGRALGAWRAEAARPDVARATGHPLAGFDSAFRTIDGDGTRLTLFGVVGKRPVCALPAPAAPPPLWFARLTHVQQMQVLQPSAALTLLPAPCPWCDPTQAALPRQPASYSFDVTAPPPGRSLGVAFQADQGEVRFRLAGAPPIVARIPPFFGKGDRVWRVALLPPAAIPPGPVHIELAPDPGTPLEPGAAFAFNIDPDWSKLF